MWQLVKWDFKMLSRDGTVLAVLITTLALGIFAGLTGLSALSDHAQAIEAARDAASSDLEAIASGAPISARSAKAATVLIPGALAEIAVGRSRLDPIMSSGGVMSGAHRLFEGYQIASPDVLAWARFDLAALITLVLPLAIIALGVGIVADERTAGRLSLIDAAGSLPRLLTARILSRALIILVPVLVTVGGTLVIGDVITDRPARAGQIARLIALILAQSLLWWVIVAGVGLKRLAAAPAAGWLIGIWAMLAVVLPSAVASIAQLSATAPDRLDFTVGARTAELVAVKEAAALSAAYLNDHPEMETSTDTPQWMRDRFVVSRAVDDAVAPNLLAFDAALNTQAAKARQLGFISPISALTTALSDLAGTGAERQLAFRSAARARHVQFSEGIGASLMLAAPIDRQLARDMRFQLLAPNEVAIPIKSKTMTYVAIGMWLGLAIASVFVIVRTSRPIRLAAG